MSGRVRTLRVRYRSPNAFLVAYAVHVSRGGLFLEADAPVVIGEELVVRLEVGSHAHIDLKGRVSWRRTASEDDSRTTAFGVELADREATLGGLVDRMVGDFAGKGHPLRILVLGGQPADLRATMRGIHAAVATAEVISDASEAERTDDFDLTVVDLRTDADAALAALAATNQRLATPAPAVALLPAPELEARARAGGAVETLAAGAPTTELRRAILRGLARPLQIVAEPVA